MNDEPIRVLLVDDQELVRTGLRRILRRRDGFEIVAECADGDEVAAAVAAHRPDVVVMDLRMKRMSGMAATRLLLAGRGPTAPPAPHPAAPSGSATAPSTPPRVLALTTFRDDALLSEALRSGVAGFVLKDSPAEELIRAVKLVAADLSWLRLVRISDGGDRGL